MSWPKDINSAIFSAAETIYGAREAGAIARLVAEKCATAPVQKGFAEKIAAEISTSKPIQYILGTADFYDLELFVGKGVLIPRPETEELVRWIVDDNDELRKTNYKILDIGTGSGAIAIALAKNLPSAQVTGVDVSDEALKYARRNNEKYAAGVEFVQGDIFELEGMGEKFDIIASNPPYIPEAERRQMHDNVTKWEPSGSLFVPDNDPLLFYRAIARFARHALKENGSLYFEIHEKMGPQVAELLKNEGLKNIELREDINSKPRMVKCTQ